MMFTGGRLARRARFDYLLDKTKTDLAFTAHWLNQRSLAKPCALYKKDLAVRVRYNRAAVASQIPDFCYEWRFLNFRRLILFQHDSVFWHTYGSALVVKQDITTAS